jgi:hypothetical protein
LRDGGSDSLPDPYMSRLSVWLRPEMVGPVARQTHTCMGSVLG